MTGLAILFQIAYYAICNLGTWPFWGYGLAARTLTG